ncbi:sugar ABC transporter [Xaviernesmea oryzae]|uniref:Sugar ABC transporter n=1 Tax=Xaviernesmea oryzae TaxID=464029 RepID=A0A1Q9B3D6_9HYPH|nr:ABC transporter ATP-binding protein [Xaviernesmea oryzae]OLP62557.1 sugar ABC transporter [Xaviernesmea oryzae]SEM19610.1 energy-coupling factor transport system ATP-binding protein [Xaviernesmea oryzae]
MLDIDNLTLGFGGAPVLCEARLTLLRGQRLLVCGAAGSGKTSLLSVAAGLIPRLVAVPELSGNATLDGQPLGSVARQALFRRIGFIGQNLEDQLWDLCVEDVIAFPLENRGIARSEIRARLERLITGFGLSALSGRRVLTLSGGERRMVAVAAALAAGPDFLVMDEPTTGLDPAARRRLCHILDQAAQEVPTLLIADQDAVSLLPVIDSLALLQGGKLSTPQPPADCLENHAIWEEAGLLPPMRRRRLAPASAIGRPLLAVSGLVTRLARAGGDPVLKDVTFDIRAGEVVALIGRNGAGKTTLFKAMLGLTKAAGGTIALDGAAADRWTVAARARKLAYIPQNMRHILFNMSVIGEVIFAITASTARSADPAIVEKARAALARYDLGSLEEANPFALSVRQQGLLGLACADAAGALVAIIDEPLLARDLHGRAMLERFIAAMRDTGRAVMLISHDLELVDDLASRLMLLDQGRIAYDGPLAEGWRSPAFTALSWPAPYADMPEEAA